MRARVTCALLVAAALLGFAGQAQAQRILITSKAVEAEKVPGGGIEGACGLAVSAGQVFVSDYYHHAIDAFARDETGTYQSQLHFGSLSGPCQLATSPSGARYVNDWHEGVSRLLPSVLAFDASKSTGVAVDQATGNVYVDDRTYVAVYEPSGALLMKVGEGTLKDGYGIAVFGGKVYVPDASDQTVKVYEPTVDTTNPTQVIDGKETPQGGFNSLTDAAVAVDPTNGHLLVLDNLQPGFEAPQAAIDEFDAKGTFLAQLAKKVIDGEPSGLAFGGANLYATSGNSEGSQVLEFGPYTESGGGGPSEAQGPTQPTAPTAQVAPALSEASTASGTLESLTQANIIQRDGIKVSFDGRLTPRRLPRHGSAPVRVAVSAKVSGTEGKDPPQLRTISIAINRYGRFDPTGIPLCTERDIQPATTQNALKACRDSLVGVGSFEANVALSQQSPFPAKGRMYAFNARLHGRPAILAHVYGTQPVPTSFTFPFELKPQKGTFGTVLTAKLPHATGDSGFITGLAMNLGRTFTYKGKRRSYLSGSCPAPKGLSRVPFPFARASFAFKGGRRLGSTLVRSCGVR